MPDPSAAAPAAGAEPEAPKASDSLLKRLRIPQKVPPFSTRTYYIFTAIWFAALLLAIVGPIGGLYQRYMAPGDNSQLVLGSRAGFAVSPQDATLIRYTLGPYSREAGIRKGDDIIAIYGLPVPEKMPVTDKAMEDHPDDPAYIAMGNLLFGTEELPFPLTVRARDGSIREVTVTTGEQHVNAAAVDRGFSPTLLGFVDIVHVIFYPFLIWAAWILHRRNARDAVSSILSLSILLMVSAELPSSAFLDQIGVPFRINVIMFDLHKVLLIAGIVLFPHGELSWRRVLVVGAAPIMLFLRGIPYNAWLIGSLILALLIQIRCLRVAQSDDLRNQIRWALFGFSGYSLFYAAAWGLDQYKYLTGTFSVQLSMEVAAGFSLGLSVATLQFGLLIALIRYRLYDAEAIISRTASIAIMAIGLTAIFAGVMEGIITAMQDIYPEAQTQAAMAGAIAATVFIHPLHERVQKWVERRFHKAIIEIREELPELMRDTRDTASLDTFLSEVLTRLTDGFHATRAAIVLGGSVAQTVGTEPSEVLRWLTAFKPKGDGEVLDCVPEDHTFPLRLQIETSTGQFGWLLIGPRPDGSIPGGDEQEALEKIAGTLGRSIRIVLSREEDKQEMLQLIEAQGLRIERIERSLKLNPQ